MFKFWIYSRNYSFPNHCLSLTFIFLSLTVRLDRLLLLSRPLLGSHLCSTSSDDCLPHWRTVSSLFFLGLVTVDCGFISVFFSSLFSPLQDGPVSNLHRFAAQSLECFLQVVAWQYDLCWLRNGASVGGRHGWLSFHWVGGDYLWLLSSCCLFFELWALRVFPGKSGAAAHHDEPGPTWLTDSLNHAWLTNKLRFFFLSRRSWATATHVMGLHSQHERLNWCGMIGFLHVPSDPSQGENMKDSQRLEPQFILSLTGFMHVLVIDWVFIPFVIDICMCLQD